ncbi:unnamed protein product, partial [Didymodactylos carnosus]
MASLGRGNTTNNEAARNDNNSNNLVHGNTEISTVDQLNEQYQLNQNFGENPLYGSLRYIKKYYKPSPTCFKRQLYHRIPFIEWIQNYNLKQWILSDIISGLTIGIVHIPQGLGYAILAGLPPVTGLYVSFFPVLLYAFLGSSRHLSIGTFAVTSLMILAAINSRIGTLIPPDDTTISSASSINTTFPSGTYANQLYETSEQLVTTTMTRSSTSALDTHHYLSDKPDEAKIMIATALAFVAGIIHIGMAILHFGYVTVYLSDSIVQGFTTGCAIHIITSQIPPLLGIKIKTIGGQSKIIKNWIEIFKNIKYSNGATVIIGSISIALFAGVRDQINERFKSRMPLPVPIELIIVILGTGLSAAFNFDRRWKVAVVGTLRLGGFPICVALSRCAVVEGTGGKTQIVGILASIIVLIVILAVGPVFRTLPNACLAAIIVTAMKNMLLQTKQLPALWRTNKLEFLAWMITFSGVVLLDVDYGLYIGVVATILLLIIRTQRPHATSLGCLKSGIYEDKGAYPGAADIPNVKIFRFEENIYYANIDAFKKLFIKKIDFQVEDQLNLMNEELLCVEREFKASTRQASRPNKQLQYIKQRLQRQGSSANSLNNDRNMLMNGRVAMDDVNSEQVFTINEVGNNVQVDEIQLVNQIELKPIDREKDKEQKIAEIKKKYRPKFEFVIIDCSPLNYIDIMGIKTLIQ